MDNMTNSAVNLTNNKKNNNNGGIFDNISNAFSKMMNDT
jgi:hypothetical protein